jgi:hypothetical protein
MQCGEVNAELQWEMSSFWPDPHGSRTKKPSPLDRDVLRKCRSYVYLAGTLNLTPMCAFQAHVVLFSKQ